MSILLLLISSLPDEWWRQLIVRNLSVKDLLELGRSCRDLRQSVFSLASRTCIWQHLVDRDLFTVFPLIRSLCSHGLLKPEQVHRKDRYPLPEDWRQYYADTVLMRRLQSATKISQDTDDGIEDDQLSVRRLQQCRERIVKGSQSSEEIIMDLLSLLDIYPGFVPAHHLLASFCYSLNEMECALDIADIGQRVYQTFMAASADSDLVMPDINEGEAVQQECVMTGQLFGPLEELCADIEKRLLQTAADTPFTTTNDDKRQPLLIVDRQSNFNEGTNDPADGMQEICSLSPQLESVVREIFNRFDTDSDNYLSYSDMSELLTAINGRKTRVERSYRPSPAQSATNKQRRMISKYLPPAMYTQLCKKYAPDSKNGLTVDGLLAFYLEQTCMDPEETLKDLYQLGYDTEEMFLL